MAMCHALSLPNKCNWKNVEIYLWFFNKTTFFRSFSPIFNGTGAENAQRGWLTPHSPLSQARPKLDESGGGEGRRVMETNVVVLVFWKQSDNRRLLILWCVLECACMLFATREKLVGSGRHVQVTATSIIDFTEISPAWLRKAKAGRRRDIIWWLWLWNFLLTVDLSVQSWV